MQQFPVIVGGSRLVPGIVSMFTSLSGLKLKWQKNISLLSSLAIPFVLILILQKGTRFTLSVLLFLWLLISLILLCRQVSTVMRVDPFFAVCFTETY